MASLFKRKDSGYWWIKCKDQDGVWRNISTKLRHSDAKETKQARARCASTNASELSDTGDSGTELWESWVPTYLRTHCSEKKTFQQYTRAWSWLRSFFVEKRISIPRKLMVVHIFEFIDWRIKQGVKKSTALVEVKVLRVLMRYAMINNWAQGNPCAGLGIKRDAPKQKKELSDEDIDQIYTGLASAEKQAPGSHEWMQHCFSIALHTGCRLSETRIAFEDVDFNRRTITFAKPKGGSGKAYTIPLPADLEPMLRSIRDSGATHTVDFPAAYGQKFSKFFHKKIKRPDLTFHCTRVTRITRLLRAGVEERTAMLLVNHSSSEVSRIYQRLRVEDVLHAADKVSYLSLPVSLPKPESLGE